MVFTNSLCWDRIYFSQGFPFNLMKISQKRQIDRFKRSLEFMKNHQKDFSPNSQAIETQKLLKDVIDRAESNVSETSATKPDRRVYNSDKLTALNNLRAELGRISRTASLIASKDESFDNTFQMPDKRRKNDLAEAARHFIQEFPKVSDKFKSFEMDKNNVEKLKSALENYEQSQIVPEVKPERGPRKTTTPNPIVAQGVELVDALDVIMDNKYNENSDVLNQWKEVSALEVTRRPRKNKNADA